MTKAEGSMHVAHIIAGLHSAAAGPSYTVPKLADALARQGVRGHIHTLCHVSTELTARSDVLAHPASAALRRLGISPAMRRALLSVIADLFHNNGIWMMPNVYAGAVARQRRMPLIFSPRGMFSEQAMALSRRRKQFVWRYLGQSRAVAATTCFHATSESEARDIRRLGFRQPVAVIPNGIDLPGSAGISVLARERRRALFLSRIHPIKGVPILLRAWQRVEPRHPEWELVVAGPDERGHLAEVQALARQLGVTRVAFPGAAYGAAKDALYRSADLFVLPTHSESFGVAIAEALAHEVPVVTTTGAPWAGLEEHDCGWWIELSEGNVAEALHAAMSLSEERRAAMGRRGRRWMEEWFNWPKVATDMKAVYEWVLGDGAPPCCVMTEW